MTQHDIDIAMMRRCIALSATAPAHGDLPIGGLVCEGEDVLGEGLNEVRKSGDVTRHAEIVAMAGARARGRSRLGGTTLYATVEPCPMCSFALRELRVARVVYAISSPVMGGVSKWNVMRDPQLSDTVPEIFGAVPEVVSGLLWQEAMQVWWAWNPVIWTFIQHRGCFAPPPDAETQRLDAIPPQGGWLHSLLTFGNG